MDPCDSVENMMGPTAGNSLFLGSVKGRLLGVHVVALPAARTGRQRTQEPPAQGPRCRFCLQDTKIKADAVLCYHLEPLFLRSPVVRIGLASPAVKIDTVHLHGASYTN